MIMSLLFILLCSLYSSLGHPDFRKCTHYVRNASRASVTDDVKLHVYSLFKQATAGDCPKGSLSTATGIRKLKLQSWCALSGMTTAVAEDEYVKLIDKLVPKWRSDAR